MSNQMDDRTYRNVLAAIIAGRAQTAAMAKGRKPGEIYPATPEEQAQFDLYAETYASVDDIEQFLGGKK